MFERQDRAYFLRRAREERDTAEGCGDKTAEIAHLRLAEEYERRAKMLTAEDEGEKEAARQV